MVTQHPEHERRDATEEEIKELRHVVDSVPLAVWVALVANATERFTFYAVTTPWRTYHQSSLNFVCSMIANLHFVQRTTYRIPLIASPFLALWDWGKQRLQTLRVHFSS